MNMRRRFFGLVLGLAVVLSGCGSSATTPVTTTVHSQTTSTQSASQSLPSPTTADATALENATLKIINGCLNVSVGGITSASTKTSQGESELAATVATLIGIFQRVNPEAIVPNHAPNTTRSYVHEAIGDLNRRPPAPAGAPACAPELAKRLSHATRVE